MSALAVVVPLGPNPAALLELLWQLQQQGERVSQAFVVLESARAAGWWEDEGEAAYDELQAACPAVPERKLLDIVLVDDPEDQAAAFGQAVFAALQRAQDHAPRVIVALSGGRWRGSTALMSTAFQLLARPDDLLVDVRVDTPAAEGASGFFFPAQRQQALVGRWSREPFMARDVRVILNPIPAPKLRPFLVRGDLGSFAKAVDASGQALREAEPPTLDFDLFAGSVTVSGQRLDLSMAHLPLYAWVAAKTRVGGIARTRDIDGLLTFLNEWLAVGPVQHNSLTGRRSNGVVSKLLDGRLSDGLEMSTPFSRVGTAVRKALEKGGVPRRDLLTIEHDTTHDGQAKLTRMLLRLPPERIRFEGTWTPSMLGAAEA